MYSHEIPEETFLLEGLSILYVRNIFTCAYQGVRNISFSENFAYVRNE